MKWKRSLSESSPQLVLMRWWRSLLKAKGSGNCEVLRREAKNCRVSLIMHGFLECVCMHRSIERYRERLNTEEVLGYRGFWPLNPSKTR